MTVENISRSISMKEMLSTRWGLNPQPPDYQLDAHPAEPSRPANPSYVWFCTTKKKEHQPSSDPETSNPLFVILAAFSHTVIGWKVVYGPANSSSLDHFYMYSLREVFCVWTPYGGTILELCAYNSFVSSFLDTFVLCSSVFFLFLFFFVFFFLHIFVIYWHWRWLRLDWYDCWSLSLVDKSTPRYLVEGTLLRVWMFIE